MENLDHAFSFIKTLQTEGWGIRYGSTSISISAPNQHAAERWFHKHLNSLELISEKVGWNISVSGGDKLLKIVGDNQKLPSLEKRTAMSNEPIILDPNEAEIGVEAHDLFMSPSVYKAISFFYENPTVKGGLIRLNDMRQVALSKVSSQLVGQFADIKKALDWQREDYFYLPDLEVLNTEWPQELEINNSEKWHEYQFRAYEPSRGPIDRTPGNWLWFRNKCRLIEDKYRNRYHLFVNLEQKDMEDSEIPEHYLSQQQR